MIEDSTKTKMIIHFSNADDIVLRIGDIAFILLDNIIKFDRVKIQITPENVCVYGFRIQLNYYFRTFNNIQRSRQKFKNLVENWYLENKENLVLKIANNNCLSWKRLELID